MCSVVVPCFNAASSIAAAAASVLACARVQEVIFVDDGSTDGTADILHDLQASDRRVRVILRPRSGLAVALNVGICASQHDTIAFLDAADVWPPGHLDAHLSQIAADPNLGASLSTTSANSRSPTAADLLVRDPSVTCSALVIKRAVIESVGLFNIALAQFVEREWLLRASLAGWRIAAVPAALPKPRGFAAEPSPSLRTVTTAFETMLREAKHIAPQFVEEHEAQARAVFHRDMARLAYRLGLPPATARQHMLAALTTWPFLIATEPRETLRAIIDSLPRLPHATNHAGAHSRVAGRQGPAPA